MCTIVKEEEIVDSKNGNINVVPEVLEIFKTISEELFAFKNEEKSIEYQK